MEDWAEIRRLYVSENLSRARYRDVWVLPARRWMTRWPLMSSLGTGERQGGVAADVSDDVSDGDW